MDEWKASFRDIYGRSPKKEDMQIAPAHIKELMQTEKKSDAIEENEKPSKRGVKRKNFEMKMMENEQFSPVKKRTNVRRLDENFLEENRRISPRKKPFSLEESPTKESRKLLSPMKRLGDTPHTFDLDDLSPMKSKSSQSAHKITLTPIKSPTKRAYQRQLFNRDLGLLLLPTPEKQEENQEPEEEFDDETNQEVAKARAYKPVARRLGGSSSKGDQNFQKINLRKKQFVRGKVTAEQKRKFKRKQMFRKNT